MQALYFLDLEDIIIVHADIPRDFVMRGYQTTVWWSVPAVFSNFGHHIFCKTLKLKPTLLCSVMKCVVSF